LDFMIHRMRRKPALVPFNEIRMLRHKLAILHAQGGFFIQGGDCAETFGDSSRMYTAQRLAILSAMYEEIALHFKGPLLVAGRLAGQFAKPRSNPTEVINGAPYTSYYGDIVNGQALEAREPDPKRMADAYMCAQEVLDDIRRITLNCNPHSPSTLTLGESLFTAHESYLLPYEQALCRQDTDGRWYSTSAHCLWVGERTRQPTHAHIHFVRGLSNPVGVKVGHTATPEELRKLIRLLNPERQLGRLLFITRFGLEHIQTVFPALLSELRHEPVLWMCDPMHGNTTKLPNGIKTRYFTTICDEINLFFDILHNAGEIPVGIHCEMTPLNVTECIDPKRDITETSICNRYTTACDPRLNRKQARELATLCGQLLHHYQR
jgi:3-deoxy-7-phosphoheptulonate synthase